MNNFWADKRVVVTGGSGSGFLGSFVVEKLQQRCPADIFVPRKAEFDLRERNNIHRLLEHTKLDIVIHLAASVGGIGANQEHPADFFTTI